MKSAAQQQAVLKILTEQVKQALEASYESCTNHYEVNVARLTTQGNYEHLFATNPRSTQSIQTAARVIAEIQMRFPKPEYEVSVSAQVEYGKQVKL